MTKVLHIKDAYFKIQEKAKDDFGCVITLLGLYLQRNNLTLEDMNKNYEKFDSKTNFINDKNCNCLLLCEIEESVYK